MACVALPSTKVRYLSPGWVATVSRGGSGWEVDAAGAPWSSVHALQDGHAAVITGTALQRRLLLHAPRRRVESERFVRAFPILVSATQDVNLPSTHRQATALLESRRKTQELRSEPLVLGNGAESLRWAQLSPAQQKGGKVGKVSDGWLLGCCNLTVLVRV